MLRASFAVACLLGVAPGATAQAPAASPAAHASPATPTEEPALHAAAAILELHAGDHLCVIGNALAERLQHDGWFETRLQARAPELQLSVRNLGFTADELTIRQRTQGFGTPDEWLARCEADVVFAFFGFNEAFRGAAYLPKFRADLADFVENTRALRTGAGGTQAPRLVLFSPTPCEELHDPHLPDAATENARLAPYVLAMAEVAREHGVPFVDLFAPMSTRFAEAATQDAGPLTIDGVHFDARGNASLSAAIEAALFPAPPSANAYAGLGDGDDARMQRIRGAVRAKDALWWNRYRVTDGYNVYGGRSSLEYDGVTNFAVLQREMEILDAETANLDREIWAAARDSAPTGNAVDGPRAGSGTPGGATAPASGALPPPVAVPPDIAVATNRPGDGPGGAHVYLDGEAAIAQMTPAPGMRVKLFADEQRFPELANPVQMAWDTRGRLWVAAWPTYPHWAPGDPTSDKLLILEDEDGDGRADTCKVFADNLHNPTGFEFWNGGVFVAAAPDLLFIEDTDGDDRADSVERVLGGLSSSDTHHTANSFVLGPDGALYFQEGIFHQTQIESVYGPVRNHDACAWRYEPRTRRVQRYAPFGFLNPHGHVFDRWGQDFLTDGTTNENYLALMLSGHVEEPRSHGGAFTFFPQRSRPAAATEILSSSHFPAANQGNYLIANVIGFQGIFQYRLADDGSGFSATEVEPIMHSADENFRPVDLEVGPDGALYVLDWQAALIGHMQHHLRDPSRDHSHGRVYRVTCTGRPLTTPVPIAGRPIPELLELLKSPDDRVRYRTRIELSGRDSDEVVRATRAWTTWLQQTEVEYARASDREHELLEALWLQQQHAAVDRELLLRMLASPEPRARAAAVRVLRSHHSLEASDDPPELTARGAAGRNADDDLGAQLDLLAVAIADGDPRVRLEAVVACSFFPETRAAEIALAVLRSPMDRFLDYALAETLATLAPQWRAALTSGAAFAADNPAGLAMLLARLDTAELAGVRPGEALFREQLGRPGLPAADILRAATNLARARGTTSADELLAAIERGDARSDGHADHLLIGLFNALATLPAQARAPIAAPLRTLSTAGHRPSTRRLATAARLRADGSIDPAWGEASHALGAGASGAGSIGPLTDLLDAAPLLDDPALAEALFPRVLALLDAPPDTQDSRATRGRFVRVELPGEQRTLTLAEVQVISGGRNVAPRGSATQSSVAWGGIAERAIDGNASGAFGDEGQSHTLEDQPHAWWELDLGAELPIDAIVLWNRTEDGGRWIARLDGFVLRVLDEGRRTVFEARGERAPAESVTFALASPAVQLRRAAVRCLAQLGVRQDEAVRELVTRFPDEDLRPAVVSALRSVPPAQWPVDASVALADMLVADFTRELAPRETQGGTQDDARRDRQGQARPPAQDFRTDAGRGLLALADDLASRLDDDLAQRLRTARAPLGPQVFVIRPVRDSLSFDRRELYVQVGRAVELLFENTDIMPHNLVVTAPGALARVGLAGERMSADKDAWTRGYVPDLPEVLHATRLLPPGESQTLVFDAPAQPGDHPFVCTFPGHWIRMNGVLHVVSELDATAGAQNAAPGTASGATAMGTAVGATSAATSASEASTSASAATAPARTFVRNWTAADFAADIRAMGGAPRPVADDAVATARETAAAARGRAVLEAASCLRCHAVGSEGGRTGPELHEGIARHVGGDLLLQIIEPSRTIADGYAAELFFLQDGSVTSGRVLHEDAGTVSVQDNPYAEAPRELQRDQISERRTSEVSVMPEGLLSTFSRDEILDLIAYIESLRLPAADAAR